MPLDRLGVWFLAVWAGGAFATAETSAVQFPVPPGERLCGAALAFPRVYTWGDKVRVWELPAGGGSVLEAGEPAFGAGGCLFDAGDGRQGLILLERAGAGLGRMVWLDPSAWRRHAVDSGADFRDCLEATLHGRRGVLVLHRSLQVRFYEPPEKPGGAWPYRELYSIYTPSRQGGLLTADVDGDGRTDILAGNYWIRSPERFELPWRLFAVNLWTEEPESAMSRLALAPISGGPFPDLVACQSQMPESRLAWFSRPEDPTALWTEHRLEGLLKLRFPQALAAGDLDGDGRPEIAAGEAAGPGSRLIVFWNQGGGKFRPQTIATTSGLLELWIADADRDGAADLVAAGPEGIFWWPNQRLR